MTLQLEAVPSARFSAIRAALPGQVHCPGDEGYAAAIAGFSLSDQPTPDIVLTASSAADVAAAVACARAYGLGIGVLATGHNLGWPTRVKIVSMSAR